MLPDANRAGCSTNGGGCRTCPNAPKTPGDWYRSIPPATLVLLKLIIGVSVACDVLKFAVPSLLASPQADAATTSLAFDELSGLPSYQSNLTWSYAVFRWVFNWAVYAPRQLFDYSPVLSLSFLFDVYLFATFMGKLEIDIFGGYVLDFFDFPAQHLFTATQLATMRDGESRRSNVLVRSLRTVWAYFVLSVGSSIAFWVVVAPMQLILFAGGFISSPSSSFGGDGVGAGGFISALVEASRPTHVMVTTVSAVWCFLAPSDTRLQLPFTGMFKGSGAAVRDRNISGDSDAAAGAADGEASASSSSSSAAAPPPPMASERRTNATYNAYVQSQAKATRGSSISDGLRARHYPYAMAAVHWVLSGGAVMALLRELVAIRVVGHVYASLLSNREGRDKRVLSRRVEEGLRANVLDKVFGPLLRGARAFDGLVFGGAPAKGGGGGGGGGVGTTGNADKIAAALPRYESTRGEQAAATGGGSVSAATIGSDGGLFAPPAPRPLSSTMAPAAAAGSVGAPAPAPATVTDALAPYLRLTPRVLALQAFVYNDVLLMVPRVALDVPRVACRWYKRVVTVDKMERLKGQGALTPWAH